MSVLDNAPSTPSLNVDPRSLGYFQMNKVKRNASVPNLNFDFRGDNSNSTSSGIHTIGNDSLNIHRKPISIGDKRLKPRASMSMFDRRQPEFGSPFLRALHPFDASSLTSTEGENPAAICLSFQESEIVLLHTFHASGWGDATILSTGVRGWIPTNYFISYSEDKVVPLLSAVLGFSLNPKSVQVEGSSESTFSQTCVTNIVAGVRSLLESCGTLTRDTSIVRRSQSIRKFRKILLAELAILVSLAKQYRDTTDMTNIQRLVTGSYKIVSRAVIFLDIWTIDTSNTGQDYSKPSSVDTMYSSYRPSVETIQEQPTTPQNESFPNSHSNRDSVIFHTQPPFARQRLDEVNDALTSYLGNFIHRMTILETDPAASTQILINTRKSMLACRELLATVESISSRSLPRNKDLENSKDKLFAQIRNLVTAAREVVSGTNNGDTPELPKEESRKLINIATDCAKISGECVVRCRHILERIGDFELPSSREYPDFSNGIIASRELPQIPVMSPLTNDFAPEETDATNAVIETEGEDYEILEKQLIQDETGRIRGGTIEALIRKLTEGCNDSNPLFVTTFFLTFRQFSSPNELSTQLFRRYDADADRVSFNAEELENLMKQRTEVYVTFKRWLESYWKHDVDNVCLTAILSFANQHFNDIPNAKIVMNDLARRVQEVHEGQVVKREISIPGIEAKRSKALEYSQSPFISPTVNKHLLASLMKAIETQGEEITVGDDEMKSVVSNTTWSSSLRMVKNVSLNVIGTLSILDVEPADIARQLCVMDNKIFCRIRADELLDLNFASKKRHLNLAPNINEMTEGSNRLSSYVGDSILSADSTKARKNILKHWLKICEQLHLYRNFNSLMTIISALQSVNIVRLKRTWELLSPRYHQIYSALRQLMSMEKNYGSYRAILRQNEVPTIPFLGLYLTDLTFVNEGNSTHRVLSNKMVINFDRYERTTRIIGDLLSFQMKYRIVECEELAKWMTLEMKRSFEWTKKDRNGLWRRSCLVEPK